MIEEKLMKMGHDPSNVQVIISDDDERNKTIVCWVNDAIKQIDSMPTHVIEESREPT